MNRLRYNITLLLMLMAYSAASQAPIQHPFIVSYWVKAQNDTVSTVHFSDYDPTTVDHQLAVDLPAGVASRFNSIARHDTAK